MNRFYPEGKLVSTLHNEAVLTDPDALRYAAESGEILEARAVMCDPGHNMIVDIPHARAVIPREKGALGIAEGRTRDIALLSRVSKPVCFVIEEISEQMGVMQLSLSRVAAQQRCLDEYISGLTPGDVIPARVTHMEPFGAFVDIGCGIPSLIPIDAISVSRISHPNDRFYNGQNIFAVVKATEGERVWLSHKELLGSWEENASRFEVGATVAGVVRSIEEYGIFIEIAPNLAGLAEPRGGIEVGQCVTVNIKSIRPERMKLKLAIVDTGCRSAVSRGCEYFITGGHISRWEYSPSGCIKQVVSDFSD